jgi:hypothetical protein
MMGSAGTPVQDALKPSQAKRTADRDDHHGHAGILFQAWNPIPAGQGLVNNRDSL